MHSSRMRTSRLLPVSPSMHCSRGMHLILRGYLVLGDVPAGGCTCPGGVGVYLPGGTWSRGVPGPRGCICRGRTCSRRVYLPMGVYLVLGGVPAQGGVPGPGGCTYLGGVPGPGGCTYLGVYLVPGGPAQVLPPVNRITDACENTTLPHLRCGR